MRSIGLQGSGGTLTLETDERGWCRLWLAVESRSVYLGADASSVVRDRLARALEDAPRGNPIGKISGEAVHWVLSLSEAHGSIYVADVVAPRRLFLQDAQGKRVGQLTLSEEQVAEWRRALLG